MEEVSSSAESLLQAVQAGIIPNQEFLLQGSILDDGVTPLVQLLRGLCDDDVDSVPETFQDMEVCLTLHQPEPNGPLTLRVRRAMDREAPFQLRYVGQPEIDPARPTLVRSSIDVACSDTVLEFLTELGCTTEFEYICRGYIFRKGRMKITISKIINRHAYGIELLTQSHLVELSVVAPSGQESIGEEMSLFADQLRPLVQLEKIDYIRLGGHPQ